jgi:hypothetical protein
MNPLKIYIDVYGRVGLCEKFPDDEKHYGLNELLSELIEEDLRYCDEFEPGFYMAHFALEADCPLDGIETDYFLLIDKIEPMDLRAV